MGLSERKEREKQARKESIFEAARRVFQEKGYQLTSMSKIAEEAELSKATIYLYFKNKDDLFLSMTTEPLKKLKKEFEKIAKTDKSPEEKIFMLSRAFVKHWEKNRVDYQLGDTFITTYNRQSETNRSLFNKINEPLEEILNIGIRILKDGIKTGSFKNEIDPEKVMLIGWRAFVGLLQIVNFVDISKKEGAFTNEILDLAIMIIFDGIKKRA
ncbi:MAG: TetR/AcrR family transcriptional regulator [Deltaproteobacteria bacterium]|nr:TetR/AcrR family transcriptional regulator [Deltaproteobacteria bacterium]